ncbi:DUF342 domain-containing protein [bacterium]|nr:DUF342 domain-containing protein [bacterium]
MDQDVVTERKYDISVSNDKMQAVLEAYAPIIVNEDEILKDLRENEHLASLRVAAVQEFVTSCAGSEGQVRVIVAEGEPPVHGRDGQFEFSKELQDEEERGENERVDWYEQSKLKSVARDQLIAILIPPTEAKDGIDVIGEVSHGKEGKPASIQVGQNIAFSEESGRLVAETDGILKYNGRSISVEPVYKVNGNVDFETGNIDIKGKVVIQGNVLDQFKVKASEGIEIKGLVEGASLKSPGDISIKGGVAGKGKCVIAAGGNLDVNYIDQAKVKCAKDISVNVEVLNSNIESRGTIFVKQGGIVGGRVVAGVSIETKTLGSEAGIATEIVVGHDPALASKLNIQRMKERGLVELIKNLERKISVLDRIKDRLPPDKREILTELFYEQAEKQEELEAIRDDIRLLLAEDKDLLKNASLFVQGRINQGVVIEIGGVKRDVMEALDGPLHVKFDVAKKRIMIVSSRETTKS